MKADASRMGSVWDDAPLPSQTISSDGLILAVNRRWHELTDHDPGETVGRPCVELVPASYRRGPQKSFEVLWEARRRALFDLAPNPSVVHDGRAVVRASAACARSLCGGSAASFIGTPVSVWVHPALAPQVAERVKRVMTEERVAPLPMEQFLRDDHHERLDGSGHPKGLVEDRLPLEAMSSHRPYQPSPGIEDAIEEIVAGRGVRSDADIVDACGGLLHEGFELQAEGASR